MIALYTILIILGLVLVAFEYLYTRWKRIREGVTVYRCTPDMKICNRYHVIIIGSNKYLVDLDRREPYMDYNFRNYLIDIRNHHVFTEEQVDILD